MAHRTRDETVALIGDDIARLLRAIDVLSEEQRRQPVCGQWTAREVLAHIGARDRLLAESVDGVLADREPALRAHASRAAETAFNRQAVAAIRDTSFDTVLVEMRESHEALVDRLGALSDDEWQHAAPYRWGNGTPVTTASLFDYSYKGATHYAGHAQKIEDWAAAR